MELWEAIALSPQAGKPPDTGRKGAGDICVHMSLLCPGTPAGTAHWQNPEKPGQKVAQGDRKGQILTWKDRHGPQEIGRTAVALSLALCCGPQTNVYFISHRIDVTSPALKGKQKPLLSVT